VPEIPPDRHPTERLDRKDNAHPDVERWEEAMNWITDQELEWWPFGFLKPKVEQRLSTFRVAILAVLYGVPAGLLAVIGAKLLGDHVTPSHLVAFPVWTSFAFLVVYRGTFAYFWNRRAARAASVNAAHRST
jgi:hypothetical protein